MHWRDPQRFETRHQDMVGAGDTGRPDAAGRRGVGMSDPDPFDDCVIIEGKIYIIRGGNPRPQDVPCMLSTVWCQNGDIIPLLEERERQRARRATDAPH
jgi:hypothetical protein